MGRVVLSFIACALLAGCGREQVLLKYDVSLDGRGVTRTQNDLYVYEATPGQDFTVTLKIEKNGVTISGDQIHEYIKYVRLCLADNTGAPLPDGILILSPKDFSYAGTLPIVPRGVIFGYLRADLDAGKFKASFQEGSAFSQPFIIRFR